MSEYFDEAALMDRLDGDMEFLEDTVEMLEEDSVTLLKEINDAATTNDINALVHSSHSLKGMLSNFCAEKAVSAARNIEMMARESKIDGINEAINVLQKEVSQLKQALSTYLQENKT